MKYVYPAIFTWYEPEKVYLISFPDSESWFTEGYSLTEAMENAADILNFALWNAEKYSEEIPTASKIEDIKFTSEDSFAQYIFADTETYAQLLSLKKIAEAEKIESA